MPDGTLKPSTDTTIRYDAAVKYLRAVFEEYELDVAAVAVSPNREAQRRRFQAAHRNLIRALLLYAHEIARLKRQHERPN